MDNSPTALFDSYEQDFKQIIHSIREKLEGDAKDVQGEQRKAALRRVEMELDEADEMVRPYFFLHACALLALRASEWRSGRCPPSYYARRAHPYTLRSSLC